MITYEYKLDMTQGGLPLKFGLKQYDSDFALVFKLFARKGTLNITSGTTVKIRGTKPDGTGYSVAASLTGSTVTVTGDQQMTAVAGTVPFELTLTKNGKELNTTTFFVHVVRAALDLDTIPSESKIQELYDLSESVDDILAAAASVEDAAESIANESAQIAANTAGITGLQTALAGVRGMVEDIGDDLYAEGTALSVSATTSNYALKGDGKRISNSNSNLKTYAVTAGKVLFLFLAADNACTYQWQSSSTVPTSGTPSDLIGTPVAGAIDAFVKVPAGATHLIVSQLKTNSTNTVKSATCKPDENAEDIAAIQEELENLDIETDSTLAVQGKPADAKATGDAISELNGSLDKVGGYLNRSDLWDNPSIVAVNLAKNMRFLISPDPIPAGVHIGKLYMIANHTGGSKTIKIEIAEETEGVLNFVTSAEKTYNGTNIADGTIIELCDLDFDTTKDTYICVSTTSSYGVSAYTSPDKHYYVCRDTTTKVGLPKSSFTESPTFYEVAFQLEGYALNLQRDVLHVRNEIGQFSKLSKKGCAIVDINGKGDYTTIVDAMSNVPEGTPIIVNPGTYEQDMTECLKKRVILIGTDPNTTILIDTDGRYNHHPLYVSCGYFANLTIYSKYISGTSNEIGTNTNGSYAVHIDNDDDYAIDNTCEFYNCIIKSDFFPAIGCGLRKGLVLTVNNCELINAQIATRGAFVNDGSLGALFVHDSNGIQGAQYLTVKNSVLKSSLGKTLALSETGRTTQNNEIYCTFINNVLRDDVNGFSNNVWFRGQATGFDNGGILHLSVGFGNSANELNEVN